MPTFTFTALAAQYVDAVKSPDNHPELSRTEEQWLADVMPRVQAIDVEAVAAINEHARRGTPGFVVTTEFLPVVRSLAAEHPEAFSVPEYARSLTGLLNGSHAEACLLLAKMAGEDAASAATAETTDIIPNLDALRDEVEAAARTQAMELLESGQLEVRLQISESTRKRREATGLIGFIQSGPKHAKRYPWVNGRSLTRAEVLSLWNSDGSTRVMTGQDGSKAP